MAGKNIEIIDKSNNIYVETGVEMNISAEDLGYCGKCTYVGQKKDQYIVVTPPPNFPAYEKELRQTDQIMVNYLFGGDIFEFTSKLMDIKHNPLMLLLLRFPISIEKKELRSQKRINCFISAKMEVNNKVQDGIIKDISKSGCRYVFENSGKLEKALRVDDPIALSFDFPGIFGRQEISGKIKEIRRKESGLDIGIEFMSIAWWVPPYD